MADVDGGNKGAQDLEQGADLGQASSCEQSVHLLEDVGRVCAVVVRRNQGLCVALLQSPQVIPQPLLV